MGAENMTLLLAGVIVGGWLGYVAGTTTTIARALVAWAKEQQ